MKDKKNKLAEYLQNKIKEKNYSKGCLKTV